MYFIKKVNRVLAMPWFLWASELNLSVGNACCAHWCKKQAAQAYPWKIWLLEITEMIFFAGH